MAAPGGFKISLMPTNMPIREANDIDEISPIDVKCDESSVRDLRNKEIIVEDLSLADMKASLPKFDKVRSSE